MDFHKVHLIKLSNSEEEYKLIIKVEKNDNFIQFEIYNANNQFKENYYLKVSKDELVLMNNYFLLFDSVSHCAKNISNIIGDCTPKLIKEKNNINLIFSIFMPGQERRDIKLILEERQVDSLKIIEGLKDEINILKTKINDLEIAMNQKDTMYNQLKNDFNELKNDYESTINQFNTDIINIKSQLFQIPVNTQPQIDPKDQISVILNNSLELNLLSNKIRSLYPGKNSEYYLLYRKSRDTGKANIFHSKCDNIRGTLIIIHTTKGYKFGGYTNATWEGNGVSKSDNTAFLFSLNYNKIYDIKKDKNAITCNPNYGPVFCGADNHSTILIIDNSEINGGECCQAKFSNYNGYNENFEINCGERYFQIKDLEVFQVKLI